MGHWAYNQIQKQVSEETNTRMGMTVGLPKITLDRSTVMKLLSDYDHLREKADQWDAHEASTEAFERVLK